MSEMLRLGCLYNIVVNVKCYVLEGDGNDDKVGFVNI